MLKTIRFKKVLIANRGAIAVRIIRTLHELGCKAVVIYHEADKHSLHVHHADESYSLGAGSVADTYLNQEKILTIAKQANAEAIHPGYVFAKSRLPDQYFNRRWVVGIARVIKLRAIGYKHQNIHLGS